MDSVNKPNMNVLESLGLAKSKPKMEEQKLGQEDFIKLMTTQMNHQDPMKPMENGDFLSDMAQFSTVAGLKEIKDSFNNLATSLQSSQALQASSMVGRTVLIPGSIIISGPVNNILIYNQHQNVHHSLMLLSSC